jgi:hypothetical protein
MIEVHVFNAFLLPDLKQTGWFGVLTFINGLIAPAFLFVSGFAFQVSSGGKLEEMRKFKFPFWKKLWRIFSIVLIGYALHIPYYSLSKVIKRSSEAQLQSFFAVDVLQCIGVSLLILFAIRLIIRSDKIYHYTLIAIAFVVMIVSPILWKTDLTNYVHPIIANYFNRLQGSLFPIFSWINFILTGAIFAKYFLDAVNKGNEQKFINGTTITGIIMLLSGHLFYSGLFPGYLKAIIPHPVFFFERLGYVLVFAGLCWYFSHRLISLRLNNKWRTAKRSTETNVQAGKSFVLDASRESLLIYWLHLITIYGMFWGGKSFAMIIGPTLNVIESITATLILMLAMIIAAKIWGRIKMKFPKYAGNVAWGIVGLLFLKFLLS